MKIQRYVFYDNPKYLDCNINQLPNYLKYKIYIWAIKRFWKSYLPKWARPTSWQQHAFQQQRTLFLARCHNIHFLHLPCNTLPSTKQYIIGCQCQYCLHEVDPVYKQTELNKNNKDQFYFYDTVPFSTESDWNERYELFGNFIDNIIYGMPIFNPDYESKKLISLNDPETPIT